MTARLVLLGLLPLTATLALLQRRRLYAIIGMALTSLLLASVFYLSQAPDVAITEAAIGAALVTFIYVLAIRRTGRLNVVASEVPGLMERVGDRIQGLEWEILDRFARRVGLDLSVQFVRIDEIEKALLQRDADLGAGGLVVDAWDRRLLTSRQHLPTARVEVVGPGSSSAWDGESDRSSPSLVGHLTDVIDAVRDRRPIDIRLDLARFLVLSRHGLDGYRAVRDDTETGYAFVVAPHRADLHARLEAMIEELRASGDLDRMAERYLT